MVHVEEPTLIEWSIYLDFSLPEMSQQTICFSFQALAEQVLKQMTRPAMFTREIHFMDMARFWEDQASPSFFSTVRDPVSMFISR